MKSRVIATMAGLAAVMLAVMVPMSMASAQDLTSDGPLSGIESDHFGYVVWNDGHDLHLQMTSLDASTTYRGTLYTGGKFRNLSRNGDRPNVRVWISDDGHTLRFGATPAGDVDEFKVLIEDSNKVYLNLERDGSSIPTDRIWIGRDDEHPGGSNFALRL